MKGERIVARIYLKIEAERAQDAYCQCLLTTKDVRCPNKAKLRCPDCQHRYCRKCAGVTICCPVSVGNRVDVESLP